MNKVKIHLKNCYGIKKLEYTFDFSQKSTYSIYAANGIMKTSFAKTSEALLETIIDQRSKRKHWH
jgi:cell division protein YceG involved in septum cleavage